MAGTVDTLKAAANDHRLRSVRLPANHTVSFRLPPFVVVISVMASGARRAGFCAGACLGGGFFFGAICTGQLGMEANYAVSVKLLYLLLHARGKIDTLSAAAEEDR